MLIGPVMDLRNSLRSGPPSATKRLPVARSIPLLPPVISATFPFSFPIKFSSLQLAPSLFHSPPFLRCAPRTGLATPACAERSQVRALCIRASAQSCLVVDRILSNSLPRLFRSGDLRSRCTNKAREPGQPNAY